MEAYLVNWKCWALVFALLTAFPSVVCAADATTVISLNDAGVEALKVNNYPLAFEKFREALKLDPDYQLARNNLAIAYNNYGLKLHDNPKEALKQFHEALYLNHTNPMVANIDGIIKVMGKNPHSFEDRVILGDESKQSADYVGADVDNKSIQKNCSAFAAA
jgi:tetratricopeptide (TPR) repeat protein